MSFSRRIALGRVALSPVFALTVTLTLALGIGATTALGAGRPRSPALERSTLCDSRCCCRIDQLPFRETALRVGSSLEQTRALLIS
jgi:hypothetical protein